MAYFTSEQEVYDTLGRLFVDMVDDDELFGKFRKSNTIVQYRFHDPDSQITVRMKEDEEPKVDLGATDLQPAVEGDCYELAVDRDHRLGVHRAAQEPVTAEPVAEVPGPGIRLLGRLRARAAQRADPESDGGACCPHRSHSQQPGLAHLDLSVRSSAYNRTSGNRASCATPGIRSS